MPISKRGRVITEAYHWYLATVTCLLGVVAMLAPQGGYEPNGPKLQVTLANHRSFVIATDPKNSPRSVKIVLALVNGRFYDGMKVHRVERWMVRWGDPQSKTMPIADPRVGTKGSGRTLPFETPRVKFMRGIVGLASAYTGVGGDGQLFVLTKDWPRLNGGYGILGKVIAGMDVVDKIRLGDKIESVQVIGKG